MPDDGAADLKALWARRRRSLERFDQWQLTLGRAHERSPEERLAAAAGLYDLLAPAARRRPVVTSGVAELHRRLGVLRRNR